MRPIALRCAAFAGIALAQPALAANDPFVGKWRLDVSRSMIVDDMRVEALGANKFAFNFEGGPTETILADGTDQPALPGTTLAVRAQDPHTMTVVRKQAGRTIISARWRLSPDGRTLRDSFTAMQPDGSRATTDYLYKRMAGRSGFAGVWESSTKPTGLKVELWIEPFGENGLSFATGGSEKKVVFDGRDHAVPGAKDGAEILGRRHGARAIEYVEKSGGKVERVHRFKASRDGRTLTETLVIAGQLAPDLLTFERE